MKSTTSRHVFLASTALLALAILQAGCATRPAPDFKGRWKPANRYAETTEAIPLHRSYLYQPSPMDGTLKNMLARWARDSKMSLAYQHPSDFTLHAPVGQVSSYSLEQAASRLTAIYAGQRVSISVDGQQIVVRQADAEAARPPATTAGDGRAGAAP